MDQGPLFQVLHKHRTRKGFLSQEADSPSINTLQIPRPEGTNVIIVSDIQYNRVQDFPELITESPYNKKVKTCIYAMPRVLNHSANRGISTNHHTDITPNLHAPVSAVLRSQCDEGDCSEWGLLSPAATVLQRLIQYLYNPTQSCQRNPPFTNQYHQHTQ